MNWDTAISALGFVFIATALISLFGYSNPKREKGILQDYLLAGGQLARWPVLHLLLSTSFGLNTILYQGYLGATVGYWGLVIQAAWAAGFFLLRRHVGAIRNYQGLHVFLGSAYGMKTRTIAAFFSLLGMTFFVGWETSIGRDAIGGILAQSRSIDRDTAPLAGEWIVVGIVVGCLAYTILGGLRGNAKANMVQNVLKFLTFSTVTFVLAQAFVGSPGTSFWRAFIPSGSTMLTNLGWWGLVTSIAFGLAWQFVDMTTWQSVAGASQSSEESMRRDLSWSGVLVFITPGVVGTLFGVFASNLPGAAENVLIASATVIAKAPQVLQFFFWAAMIASVMSLIDGLFLAATYAIVVDLLHRNESLAALDRDEDVARQTLAVARIIIVGIAAISVWLVPEAIALFGDRSIFFFSFVVIVAQLALFGPVIVALRHRKVVDQLEGEPNVGRHMWLAIVVSGGVGFLCAFYGAASQQKFLTDGAGTFTLAVSIAMAWILRTKLRAGTKAFAESSTQGKTAHS